jgi:hypothetical protein
VVGNHAIIAAALTPRQLAAALAHALPDAAGKDR